MNLWQREYSMKLKMIFCKNPKLESKKTVAL